MKYFAFLFLVSTLIPLASEEVPRFNLAQVVQTAIAKGMENKIIQGNLDAAQAQLAQTQAGSSSARGTALRLSANAGYNASLNTGDTIGTNGQVSTSSVTTLPQSISGGLTLSGPSTDISLTETHTLTTKDPGPWGDGGALALTISQALWDGYVGGATKARVDKADLVFQVAALQASANRLNLIFSIKQAYYTMLSAQENISLFDDTLQQRVQFLKTIQAKYDLKQATLVDLKTAQVNTKSAELDLKAGRDALLVSRIRLGNLMGIPQNQDFTIETEAPPSSPVPTIQEAFSVALKNRSEFKIAELNRQSAHIDLDLARGQALPSVSVSGGATLNYDLANGKAGSVFSAGLKVGMPILDGGLLQQQEAGATALFSVYDSQISQLQYGISADVQEAFSTWKLDLERLSLAQDTEEQTRLQKEIAQVKSDAGVINLSDLMIADVNYSTAQFARTKAKINSELSALQLLLKLGLQE